MKKVKHYSDDSLEFHKSVLKAKRNSKADPGYKERMAKREDVSKEQFEEYDKRFINNTLEGMPKKALPESEIEDFLRLYGYSDKCFQDLVEKLSKDENDHIYPYCPLCDIGESHSLDHILPKGEYPVLCDHPLNLIRCCTTCNGYKSEIWLERGKRKYLDLYIDDVPEVQMLFVRLGLDGDVATYKYEVSDMNHPDADLYRMYKNTFVKLHLAERYLGQTDEEISNIVDDLKPIIEEFSPTDEQLKKQLRSSAISQQKRHGVNYWRSILKLALCDDDVMFKWLKNKACKSG